MANRQGKLRYYRRRSTNFLLLHLTLLAVSFSGDDILHKSAYLRWWRVLIRTTKERIAFKGLSTLKWLQCAPLFNTGTF